MVHELDMDGTRRIDFKLYEAMGTINEEISDIGGPGPGPPVADLSAVDRRTTDDGIGTSPANDLAQIVGLPLGGQIQCKRCEAKGLNRLFLQESKFKAHMDEQHSEAIIIWRCTLCGKDFAKLHGCRCHLPKCSKGLSMRSAAMIKCDLCNEAFETRRGVSMHERHRHPELRNAKRIEAEWTRSRNRPGNRASAWSQEEVGLLIELNERFKHLKQPNVAIREFLPGKTLKQISDKGRLLPVREQEAPAELGSRTDSSSDEYHSADEEIEEIPRRDQPQTWKDPLRVAIQSGQLEDQNEFRSLEIKVCELAEKDDLEERSHEISVLLKEFVGILKGGPQDGSCNRKRKQKRANRESSNKKHSRNTRKKGYEFARYQELYKVCPKKLLDLALMGKKVGDKEAVETPSKDLVGPLYKDLWGKAGPLTHIVKKTARESPTKRVEELWSPVSVGEIITKFKKIKSKTAAGLDGITKSHLHKRGALFIFTKLCNLLLMSRVYPDEWKLNRTTLIPKPGKSVDDVNNWRPITIGSLLGRLFSAMIDKRVRNVIEQNPRQKGFTNEDGCKHNISILNSALDEIKQKGGGVITVIDISKAFDTIPHDALVDALEAKGIPVEVSEYIRKMYNGSKTVIQCKNNETIEMDLLRGVKQGDPLSPLLFNLVLDPIIGVIDETTEGIKIGDSSVSILAFADDLVLLARSTSEAQKQAKIIYEYLKKLKMEINVQKCQSFRVVCKSKSWHLENPVIKMGQQAIPYADPEATIEYLGVAMNPWRGMQQPSSDEIIKGAQCIKKMGLKPHQKVNLIRTYLLPRYIHNLVANPPPLGLLDKIDHEIKSIIKEILHLHPSTTDGLIYTEKSHGGLGVQRVANIVKLAKIKSYLKMKEAKDVAVIEACARQESIVQKYARSIGLQWPYTFEEIEATRISLRKKDTEKWRQLVSQGQGVKEFFGDEIGNKWLYHPELLKPSRYLDALKLRTNTFGTKVALNRAKKGMDVRCRRCGVQAETLGHILGNCIQTKPLRIRRHNEICKMVAENLPRHCAVFEEPTVNVLGELLKPDLVIKDHSRVYVVDVTVRYEDQENLQKAYKQKIQKYKDTAEVLRIKLNGTEAEVIPIVVGCRGAMPKCTKNNLKRLGLRKDNMLTASLIALRSSIEMANLFIDYDHIE
ncbi:Retrovirus-related Pol polyprotein from type-2 retrotransposable element R2DM [Anthophora plagiata]